MLIKIINFLKKKIALLKNNIYNFKKLSLKNKIIFILKKLFYFLMIILILKTFYNNFIKNNNKFNIFKILAKDVYDLKIYENEKAKDINLIEFKIIQKENFLLNLNNKNFFTKFLFKNFFEKEFLTNLNNLKLEYLNNVKELKELELNSKEFKLDLINLEKKKAMNLIYKKELLKKAKAFSKKTGIRLDKREIYLKYNKKSLEKRIPLIKNNLTRFFFFDYKSSFSKLNEKNMADFLSLLLKIHTNLNKINLTEFNNKYQNRIFEDLNIDIQNDVKLLSTNISIFEKSLINSLISNCKKLEVQKNLRKKKKNNDLNQSEIIINEELKIYERNFRNLMLYQFIFETKQAAKSLEINLKTYEDQNQFLVNNNRYLTKIDSLSFGFSDNFYNLQEKILKTDDLKEQVLQTNEIDEDEKKEIFLAFKIFLAIKRVF